MNKIEQLEQQISAMQQELEELKKTSVEEKPKAILSLNGETIVSPDGIIRIWIS